MNELPYIIEGANVRCLRKIYATKSGETVSIVVPYPKGPEEGWTDEERDAYLQELEQKSAPMVRSAIKRRFGTTKYRLIATEEIWEPIEKIARNQEAMLRRHKRRYQA